MMFLKWGKTWVATAIVCLILNYIEYGWDFPKGTDQWFASISGLLCFLTGTAFISIGSYLKHGR